MIRMASRQALLALILVATARLASGATIIPTSYAMPNGQQAAFTYYDDTYSGSGDKSVNLAPLAGGVGDLTDGVIPTQAWSVTPAPYVGWLTINPTIRFHFGQTMNFSSANFLFDDSEGDGGVRAPRSIAITDGTETKNIVIPDNPARGRFNMLVAGLNLRGEWLDVTITKDNGQWMMMSEAQFEGAAVPEPAHLGAWMLTLGLVAVARRRRQAVGHDRLGADR